MKKWIFIASLLLFYVNDMRSQDLVELLVNIHSVDSVTMLSTSPAAEGGHLIYNTDAEMIFVWNGVVWISLERLTRLDVIGDSLLIFANERGDTTRIQLNDVDSTNELIDSATFEGDTLRIYETETPIKVPISTLVEVAELYDTSGGQALDTGTFDVINFGTDGVVDPEYSTSPNSISIDEPGRYEITYRVSTEVADANNTRTGGEFYLAIDGAEVPGTRAYTYQRNRLVDKNTVTVTKIIQVDSPSVNIQVFGRVYAQSGTGVRELNTVANGSSLSIKRIRDY